MTPMKEPPKYRGLYILKNAFQEEYYVTDDSMSYGTYTSEAAARNGIDHLPAHVLKRARDRETGGIVESASKEDMRRCYAGVVQLLTEASQHCRSDQDLMLRIEAACNDWITFGAYRPGWTCRRSATRVTLEEPTS